MALWDRYLVYAVTLGVAKEVVRQLPLVYGEAGRRGGLELSWFVSSGPTVAPNLESGVEGSGHAYGLSGLASFASTFSSSLRGNWSSGRGRGRGFSGGGRGQEGTGAVGGVEAAVGRRR